MFLACPIRDGMVVRGHGLGHAPKTPQHSPLLEHAESHREIKTPHKADRFRLDRG